MEEQISQQEQKQQPQLKQQPQEKKEHVAMYIVYAAAAYFGLQLIFKGNKAAAATVNPYKTADPPPSSSVNTYEPPPSSGSSTTTAQKTAWVAESFPLRKGMKGAKVKAIQQKLGVTADGAFGNNTEAALLQKFGITTVSSTQYQSIVSTATPVKPSATKTATPSSWIAESFPLRKGMKGSKVKTLQQKLGVTADGAFGNNTEAALVSKFGVTSVSQALYQSIIQPVTSTISKLLNVVTGGSSQGKDTSPILKQGSKGQDVYRLQKWLGFKDKKAAKKGEPVADSIFGNQTLSALQKKTGQSFISVNHMNTLMKQISGLGYAGEVIVTKRPATILDNNLLPHRQVPENTILGTRLMELKDPQEQKAYTQFQTVDGFRRWVDKDAI